MLDKIEPFTFGGEELGLLLDYTALYRLETVHGFPIVPLDEAIRNASVKALVAVAFEGLERHRQAIAQRAMKWTIDDAARIVMTIGPLKFVRIAHGALARSCVTQEAPTEPTGKADALPASTGAPSS